MYETMQGVRGLLVAGTTSDAGKSVVTTALCRWLAREGVRVAPFKAQNMSNNSMVTADGAEIGRAQWVQAVAARAEPEAAMNPVLLKPGSDLRSHVVVMGRPHSDLDARSFGSARTDLAEAAFAALDDLARRYDVVVCEGAGSPTEINLREHDFVNMGLARHAGLPVLVVGDIDRGGVFAAFHGTVALLCAEDQALVAGFVVNKFRGDRDLLAPGLAAIGRATGRPVLGVLPWLADQWLDSEDALDVAPRRDPGLAPGVETLHVAVVRFPRISNFTDVDALAAEPGVVVRFTAHPAEVADADLAVLPGTRATVADLRWLRERGLDEAVRGRAAAGRPTLGICGGYQMLAREIVDEVEARVGAVPGLGLLPAQVRFTVDKVLGRPAGEAYGSRVGTAYAIHHGRVSVVEGDTAEPFLDGCRVGAVWGTSWHGALEDNEFRRSFLREVAAMAGRDRFVVAPDTDFAALREHRIDLLADAVVEHLDTPALRQFIDDGPPTGLPFVPPGAPD
ncbi:MAG: cobyric acid synthase [Jiangellaceae bacterium]